MLLVIIDNASQAPLMPSVLKRELQDYLSSLESHVFDEDTTYFDKQASRLIDSVRVLLEEGQ